MQNVHEQCPFVGDDDANDDGDDDDDDGWTDKRYSLDVDDDHVPYPIVYYCFYCMDYHPPS